MSMKCKLWNACIESVRPRPLFFSKFLCNMIYSSEYTHTYINTKKDRPQSNVPPRNFTFFEFNFIIQSKEIACSVALFMDTRNFISSAKCKAMITTTITVDRNFFWSQQSYKVKVQSSECRQTRWCRHKIFNDSTKVPSVRDLAKEQKRWKKGWKVYVREGKRCGVSTYHNVHNGFEIPFPVHRIAKNLNSEKTTTIKQTNSHNWKE